MFFMAKDLAIAADKKQATDQTLKLLMEHSSDFVFKYDKDGNIVYISSNVERVLGYDKASGRRHFTDILTNNPINSGLENRLKEVFEDKKVQTASFFAEVYDVNSVPQMLEVFETPFQNDLGEVVYMTCIAKNVTSIYQVELELKESERQQYLILKALPDALFMMDRDYRYVDYQIRQVISFCTIRMIS